ncbi:hypothetical protein [Chondromyces apiculatus]|nr:hypothetical protein [Chondromyces apiculatus]
MPPTPRLTSPRPSPHLQSMPLRVLAPLVLAALLPACSGESFSSAPLRLPAAALEPTGRPPGADNSRDRKPPWADDMPRPDPEARTLFLSHAASPDATLAPASSPPRVTELALTNTARGEARAMREEGALLGATLAEGGLAAVPVTLAAGECATFVAQGGLGVVEVDLFLTRADRTDQVLAEDPYTGPVAVIGGRDACFTLPNRAALSATLHAQLRRGAGVILVRGYRRALQTDAPASSKPAPLATPPSSSAPAAPASPAPSTTPSSAPAASAPAAAGAPRK